MAQGICFPGSLDAGVELAVSVAFEHLERKRRPRRSAEVLSDLVITARDYAKELGGRIKPRRFRAWMRRRLKQAGTDICARIQALAMLLQRFETATRNRRLRRFNHWMNQPRDVTSA